MPAFQFCPSDALLQLIPQLFLPSAHLENVIVNVRWVLGHSCVFVVLGGLPFEKAADPENIESPNKFQPKRDKTWWVKIAQSVYVCT